MQVEFDQSLTLAGAEPTMSGAIYRVNVTEALDAWGLLDEGADSPACVAWMQAVTAAMAAHGSVEFKERRGDVVLTMDAGVMVAFFEPVLSSTAACIRSLLAQPAAQGLA